MSETIWTRERWEELGRSIGPGPSLSLFRKNELKLNQDQLGKAVGLSRRSIGNLEQGGIPSQSTMRTLLNLYGVPFSIWEKAGGSTDG